MRSECDEALDNPSGGCPTAPMRIRSPHTIIIGNIWSQVSKREFSTVALRNLLKGQVTPR